MIQEENNIPSTKEDEVKLPSIWLSIIPILVLIPILAFNIYIYKDNATFGPNQVALLMAGIVAAVIGILVLKQDYHLIEKQIIKSIGMSMQAILILLLVGVLIGIWILSGIVPVMIYYGLKLINPTIFLPLACIVCCVASLATGSSWSTTGTVGIALIGIGKALGIDDGMVAGAIISGAYFGDKLSPLSDTTNLAPAMAGTDLFTHIRHMLYTTIPSITLAIVGFFVLGMFVQQNTNSPENIKEILLAMEKNFNLNFILLIVPVLVIVMIAKKIPAIPALIIAILLGIISIFIFQQNYIFARAEVKPNGFCETFKYLYELIVTTSYNGFSFKSGNDLIDSLFNRGGMGKMLNTVWLIVMAMIFGGTMEGTGMLQKLASSIMKLVHGAGSLIGMTLASCIFVNIISCDQYLSIVLPGRMFRKAYEIFGLHPKNLSRALEDAGTVTSVLIPWNTCAAYNSGVLNVSTLTYLPYCFFNLLSPVISGFCAGFNITIEKLKESDKKNENIE